MANALARVVNSREEDVVLGFKTRIDRDRFENSASLDAAGVWEAFAKGVAAALVPQGDAQTEADNGSLLNDARDLLRRRLEGDAEEN